MVDAAKHAGQLSIEELMDLSLEKLLAGLSASPDMRRAILLDVGHPPSEADQARFVNNHAWALVRLQAEKLIAKRDDGSYKLTSAGRAALAKIWEPGELYEQIIRGKPLPRWAEISRQRRNTINRLRWKNENAILSTDDIYSLWEDCDGCCDMTGLHFHKDKYGLGAAKRAFAPSLDRIDPAKPYTRDNCRFVLVAVNFALNAFGDEVFDRLVLARAGRIPKPVVRRLAAKPKG